jgi:acyl carrier protein
MAVISGSVREVHDWILSKHPGRDSIDIDEDLIESRLIDSLSFVEFVFIIENASGAAIDVDKINIDDFRTLSAIGKAFFSRV